MRFRRSKPCSQGIPRVISLTINADIVSRDFKGPNPFLKAFLGAFLLQLGPIVIEVDKVYGVHGVHGVIEVN